jgi:SAM-dependent methyltransferase
MGEAVTTGADLAVPGLLEQNRAAQENPPHTVSAFETLELQTLESRDREEAPRMPHPIALFRGGYLRGLAERAPDKRLDARDLERAQIEARSPARVGLCHHYSDYYGKTREDILPFVPSGVAEVLEVGCGRGFTGALLQERRGCRVTGVELNPIVAEDASQRLHEVIAGDVLTVGIPGAFDAILALELFEHLVDGEAFLKRARKLLAPGGALVLSVPNVGYHAIVTDLLAGRWDYVPIGLLCYTHVRFFTRRTLLQWLSQGGFGSVEITAQKTEVPDTVLELTERAEADLESLSTIGFYAVARV